MPNPSSNSSVATTQESLGLSLAREVARQQMLKTEPQRNHLGEVTGFRFHWAGNAPEQLEAAVTYFLKERGYVIVPIEIVPTHQ